MKYFGTDGIRGKPNVNLTVDLALAVGKALRYLGYRNVMIGTDTRVSKDMLASAVTAGCLSVGLNVYDLGIVSTPALLYLTQQEEMLGVMITASHNPYQDNGIKLMKGGSKLTSQEEKLIEAKLEENDSYLVEPGQYFWSPEKKTIYLEFLKKHAYKTNLKIVIDCANGATTEIAPNIFTKVTSHLKTIACEPNGYNINLECGSTHLEKLRKTVLDYHYDIGFAYDGDGDRVLCVDRSGDIIDGDHLVYLIARYFKDKNQLPNDMVVFTIMSNLGLIKDLEKKGIMSIETPVGDKYVLQAMDTYRLMVGGENSGHIIVKNLFSSGDGILISLFILKILEETKTYFTDWFKDIPFYYSNMINRTVKNKEKVLTHPLILRKTEEFKNDLCQNCKIIIRASGTEDVIRIMCMAQNKVFVEQFLEELQQIIIKIDM